jgi:hypothetical protein
MNAERRMQNAEPTQRRCANPKSEARNPKEGRKSEIRKGSDSSIKSVFGFRISDFLRISGFGFRISRLQIALLCSAFCILTSALPANATPTQEDVFKSISSNVDQSVDGRKMLGFLAAIVGLGILAVVINSWQQRPVRAKVTNHQGKLMRELMKSAGLKSSQIRQLKALSADLAARGQPVENLATLLLCPSLIKKAREPQPRDRAK